MTTLHTQLIVFLGFLLSAVDAQSFDRYRPIGSASSGTLSSAVGGYHPVSEANRFILPGLRPASAELLQQTLQQRYARNLGSSPERVSRLAVPKIFSDGPSLARARGIYAELRYVNQNPEWGLVGKRNATQNDLYARPLNQRAPVGMQVKTLSSGPAGYAASMLKDHRARYFVVPDDHVAGIRAHWQRVGDEHYAAGRSGEASRAYRQRARVKGMGITMAGLEKEMRAGGVIFFASSRRVTFPMGLLPFLPWHRWRLIWSRRGD